MEEKQESVDVRRSIFWQSALASASLLHWIVTNLPCGESPLTMRYGR